MSAGTRWQVMTIIVLAALALVIIGWDREARRVELPRPAAPPAAGHR